MENFTDDGNWVNNFDATSSIDFQASDSNVAFWDPMIFSDPEMLAGAQHSQSFANSNIDNIITTPQDIQSGASSNQELSYNLDTETPSPNHLASQSYNLPLEEVNEDIKKEVKELSDT